MDFVIFRFSIQRGKRKATTTHSIGGTHHRGHRGSPLCPLW